MTIHDLQLATTPFLAIKDGKKTIESRLFDEKRRAIKIGDRIRFTNREDLDQTIDTIVTGLLKYDTFHELFSHNDPSKFGGSSVEWLEHQINEFYSSNQEAENGVVGIEFVLVT